MAQNPSKLDPRGFEMLMMQVVGIEQVKNG